MSESRNARAVRQFEEYLANNDIEKITQELPKLLKLVLKLDTRMDRILKQSDNQQIEMLKLKESIEEKIIESQLYLIMQVKDFCILMKT